MFTHIHVSGEQLSSRTYEGDAEIRLKSKFKSGKKVSNKAEVSKSCNCESLKSTVSIIRSQ